MAASQIDVGYSLGQLIRRGVSVSDALEAIAGQIRNGGWINGIIVRPNGSIVGIPRPECIESHLPPGRPPTDEELREAWELCRTRS